jgi:hypothetical protein
MRMIPLALLSAALVAGLIWWISPEQLVRVAMHLPWIELTLATGGVLFALYAWDALCLKWLFSKPGQPVPWSVALYARATSYLFTAVNYEVGQGVVAWRMSQAQGIPLVSALGRILLQAFHDVGVLLFLGLAGGLASGDHRGRVIAQTCAIGLAVMAATIVIGKLLPAAWRDRLKHTRWGAWLDDWTWHDSVHLCGLRLFYYGITLLYAAVGLELCGIRMDTHEIFGVIPLVVLAASLPSISGLGTRDVALVSLLHLQGDQRAVAMDFGLFWSFGLMVGRAAIGLAALWLLPLLTGLTRSPWNQRPETVAPGSAADR